MSEPEMIGDRMMKRVEGIIAARRRDTDAMAEAWRSGHLNKTDLPCHDRCDGNIAIQVKDNRLQGQCPVFMVEEVCPLVHLHEKEMTQRMIRAGFGRQYHNADPTRIRGIEAINEYLAHLRPNVTAGRGLILSGDVGVGKTMTLGYLARQMLEESVGVWRVHMPEFVEELSARDTRRAAVERAIKVQVFMLDDFGSGDMPTWVLGILEGIVEHRYGHNKPMIITTNLDRGVLTRAPEFRRMVDRWRQKSTWVGVGGTSQRRDREAR